MSKTKFQLALFKENLCQIVNVASVRQLSPFRYPGGKTWLVPRIRRWLRNRPSQFIEPFAGGGIISLTVASDNLADRVTMVELDEQVAAVWRTIFDGNDAVWLAERIVSFDLNTDSLQNVLAQKATNTRELAFQTILKNRTYHGGILAPGSAPLKQGENGKGILSRWYPQTLKKRILYIASIKAHITFIFGDGMEIIRKNVRHTGTVFFIDPPYTVAGKKAGRRLYKHFDLNHEELFDLADTIQGDFLMTYENSEVVRKLAGKYKFDIEPVAMRNTHHAEMTELLIGRDLRWLRQDL